MLIEREAQHRDTRSYLGNLRQAQLRIRVDVQDVDRRAERGIARTPLTQLAVGDWTRTRRSKESAFDFSASLFPGEHCEYQEQDPGNLLRFKRVGSHS